MKANLIFRSLLAVAILKSIPVDARPQGNAENVSDKPIGYRVQCRDELISPGVWSYTCDPPSDDKITLDLEHVVQFKRSDLFDETPKVLNVLVPNYKIRQVIQPEILPKNSDVPPLTVNIILEKPRLDSERKEGKDSSKQERAEDFATRPIVNIEYQPIEESDGMGLLPNMDNASGSVTQS